MTEIVFVPQAALSVGEPDDFPHAEKLPHLCDGLHYRHLLGNSACDRLCDAGALSQHDGV